MASTLDDAATTRSRAAYLRSQTFLAKTPLPGVIALRIGSVATLLAVFLIVIPVLNVTGVVPDFLISKLGKYLCFGIVALGVDLIWGYTGLLSLCQALFFCIGGYAMAMHLSLPQGGGDVRPEYNDIPQFLFFNNWRWLPPFWKPFRSMPLTLLLGVAVPGLLATVFGFFILRSRVKGVYFSIITQAIAFGAWLLICRNEMLLGGTNGLTNFAKSLTQRRASILGLYLTTVVVLILAYLLCLAIVKSRLGRILVAVRDKETRLYFAGYKPYAFKVFAFAVGAMLAAAGGMLYSPQVTVISPQNMDVTASINMVIFAALGGRGRLWGSVFGAMVYSYSYACLTSDLPTAWPFIQGAMFLAVVLFFPDGFVGIWDGLERRLAAGAGFARAAVAATPIVAVGLFVLCEALGLWPAPLRKAFTFHLHSRFMWDVDIAIQWKYLLLLGVLALDGLVYYAQKTSDRTRPVRGFSVSPPAPPAVSASAG